MHTADMEDAWDDDTKARDLVIPGMALPGLRDLKIQFVALLIFDLFLGPIVYINELSRGSSYIQKLKDYQTLSEVYAGVARAEVDTLTTLEDSIAVFRYVPEGNTDITTVFFISCLPDADLSPVRKIGSKVLSRSRGDPQKIGSELSTILRELQSQDKDYRRQEDGTTIRIMEGERTRKPLKYDFIKGFGLIDLESRVADFRNIPESVNGGDIIAAQFLNFLDSQYISLKPGTTNSLLYQNIPVMIVKERDLDIFFILIVNTPDISKIIAVGNWLNLTSSVLGSEWRFSNELEVEISLEILDMAYKMTTPEHFLTTYMRMAMRSSRIKPILQKENRLGINFPEYISTDLVRCFDACDGTRSILEMANNFGIDPFEFIKFLEWAKIRNLVMYMQN